tara:strand:- start:175 stop:438 length:264 start_codon:yes stop_codon:yes gene_type:complete
MINKNFNGNKISTRKDLLKYCKLDTHGMVRGLENFNGNIQTEVYDLIGSRLKTTNETTISLQDYARGIYLLKFAYGDRVEEVKVSRE